MRYWLDRLKCLFGLHTRYTAWCSCCGEPLTMCITCRKVEDAE